MGAGVTAILAAAGHGARFGKGKQLTQLGDKPIVGWSLETFARCDSISGVVIACEPADRDAFLQAARRHGGGKVLEVVPGGARRQDSVYAGFCAAGQPCDLVLVHDGARPFVKESLIQRVIGAAPAAGAAVAAVRVKDTIKEAKDEGGIVARTVPRERLWAAQTPQVFGRELLRRAFAEAQISDFVGTDEAELVERIGATVVLVEGDYQNIKITTPEDMFVAERIARERSAEP